MDDPIKYDIESDCEEHSFCNCENTERITAHQPDHTEAYDAMPLERELAPNASQKSNKIKKSLQRLAKDVCTCNGNPYIKDTLSYQVELYKTPQDTTPIDRFQLQKSKGCSLRTLGLIASAAVVLMLSVSLIKSAASK